MTQKIERRDLRAALRTDDTGKKITGKIPYGVSGDLGGFREILQAGCFQESLADGSKIIALWCHDATKPIANTAAGTLRLQDMADGLAVEIECDPETSWGTDALAATKRGDINGLSFGFLVKPNGERWIGDLRTITNAELIEISPVVWPVYNQEPLSVRNNTMENQQFVSIPAAHKDLFYQWANESLKPVPDTVDFRSALVPDQPIYQGEYALGQQLLDIAAVAVPGNNNREAADRLHRSLKRAQALAEKRSAGTGGLVAAVAQDGGHLLQGESATDLLTAGFGNSAVISRCARRNIGPSQFVDLIGIDETARTNGSRHGGVRVYSDAELMLLTQSKPKFDKTRLEPKRLTGMFFASNEILNNAVALQQEMNTLFREEFAFKVQDLILNGSGSGEALGVLPSPSLVSVAKESGQVAATILFENLVKMESRLLQKNRASTMWVANQSCKPQLYQLSLPVGTGGSVIPAFLPSENPDSGVDGTLLGRPIVFIEQCAALGTVGDIILGDWSMYICADKGEIDAATSIHLKFDYNQTAFRFVYYFDGLPRFKSAITPFKGSNTVSPFVALATRS